MYLRDCLIENVGPISFLRVAPGFDPQGNPKPLILVGSNGSGKTVFLAHVVDALFELAKKHFRNVVVGQQVGSSPYFKVTGGLNQRGGSAFGLSLLSFAHGTETIQYADKSGTLDAATYRPEVKVSFPNVFAWPKEGNHKHLIGNEKVAEEVFTKGAICFFPSWRSEDPHWLSGRAVVDQKYDGLERRFTGQLAKPIFIERCRADNIAWILDVFLDSLIDVEPGAGGLQAVGNWTERIQLKQARRNVELILSKVLGEEGVSLKLNYRHQGSRLTILRGSAPPIPSLDHLSAGQTILFNMFVTIVRYADAGSLLSGMNLADIEGVVVVDEVDAHLHGELQWNVLPNLIKLFPKVQFIVSTHAPLFVLGAERCFGPGGVDVVELPDGQRIASDRFSEFRHSLDTYKATKAFDDAVAERIRQGEKPIVLTEGETDAIYIKRALALLPGCQDLLERLEIDWVGGVRVGSTFNTGDSGLTHTRNVYEANPGLFKRRVILLYDGDTKKPSEDVRELHVRCVPVSDANSLVRKGIEKLLPEELWSERKFYRTKENVGAYGERTTVEVFEKMPFCKWVCDERQLPSDFAGFSVVVELLREFVPETAPIAQPEAIVALETDPASL